MVNQLRAATNFEADGPLEYLGGLLSGNSKTAFDQFRLQVDAAQMVNGEATKYLRRVSEKILFSMYARLNGYTQSGMDNINEDYQVIEGVNVTLNSVNVGLGQRHTYSIRQKIDVCPVHSNFDRNLCEINVDIVAVADFGRAPTGAWPCGIGFWGDRSDGVGVSPPCGISISSSAISVANSFKINVNGSISNKFAKMEFLPAVSNNHFSSGPFSFDNSYDCWVICDGTWIHRVSMFRVNRPVIDLPIRITQLNTESPLSVDLSIKSSALDLDVGAVIRDNTSIVGDKTIIESHSELRIRILNDLNASLDMTITSASNDRLVAQVSMKNLGETISVDDAPYTLVTDIVEECSLSSTSCRVTTQRHTLNETPTDYVPFSLTANATANLVGVDPIVFSFSGKRISDFLFSLDELKIKEGDNITNRQSTVASGVVNWDGVFSSLTAVNNANINFRMSSETDGIRSGLVTDVFGNPIAELVDAQGVLSVDYVDGSQEVFGSHSPPDDGMGSSGNSDSGLVRNIHFQDPSLAYCVLESGIIFIRHLTSLSCGVSNDLTGIEKLVALKSLKLNSVGLDTLDLSANKRLERLEFSAAPGDGPIRINLSSNTALTTLHLGGGPVTQLDLSANTALQSLNLHELPLTSLNLNSNTALKNLSLRGTPLASLDISANTALTRLELDRSSLTGLNLSENTALTSFEFTNNLQATQLDLSTNTQLTYLRVRNNPLLCSLIETSQPKYPRSGGNYNFISNNGTQCGGSTLH